MSTLKPVSRNMASTLLALVNIVSNNLISEGFLEKNQCERHAPRIYEMIETFHYLSYLIEKTYSLVLKLLHNTIEVF